MSQEEKNNKKSNSKKQTQAKPKHSVSGSKNNKKSSKEKSNKKENKKKKTVEKAEKKDNEKIQEKEKTDSKITNNNGKKENIKKQNEAEDKENKDNKNQGEIIEKPESLNKTNQNENKQKSGENKKGAHESKNDSNVLFGFKEKFNVDEKEPKTNQEKRMEKLEKLRASKKRKRIIKIVAASVASLYVVGCLLFTFVCFPRTIVADTDLSFQTKNFMKKSLIPNAGEYVLRADGLGLELEIDGKDIDYNFDVDRVVDKVIELKNPLLWPYEIFMVHDFMTESVVSYNKEVAINIVTPEIQKHNQSAIPPQDANLICDPATKEISIKEEVMGNYLDPDRALASILGYIGSGRRHLECGKNEQLVPILYSDDERCDQAIKQGEVLTESVLTMVMGQATVSTLNFNTWVSWLKLKPGYIAGLNDDMLDAWAQSLANECDTLGKTRTFVTPYGKTCTVEGGDNIGWQIDQAQLKALVAEQAPLGKVQNLTVPCSSTTNGYAGPGQRDWGARYIDVDLSQQMARMYDDAGNMIWSSAIVSGKPGQETPQGVYIIKSKKSPTVLIGSPDPKTGTPSYRSPVQYWMGFVGDMVGFHDATWQSTFGGNWWVEHGSHGCVNLPLSAAGNLYSLCVSGDIVVVHN